MVTEKAGKKGKRKKYRLVGLHGAKEKSGKSAEAINPG